MDCSYITLYFDFYFQSSDFTLHSILNHIAYVNRTKSDTPLHILEANTAAIRRSQIRKVLNITYATAILGIILCITDVARIFGPYGNLISTIKLLLFKFIKTTIF